LDGEFSREVEVRRRIREGKVGGGGAGMSRVVRRARALEFDLGFAGTVRPIAGARRTVVLGVVV
jgi:hypothetical protein